MRVTGALDLSKFRLHNAPQGSTKVTIKTTRVWTLSCGDDKEHHGTINSVVSIPVWNGTIQHHQAVTDSFDESTAYQQTE